MRWRVKKNAATKRLNRTKVCVLHICCITYFWNGKLACMCSLSMPTSYVDGKPNSNMCVIERVAEGAVAWKCDMLLFFSRCNFQMCEQEKRRECFGHLSSNGCGICVQFTIEYIQRLAILFNLCFVSFHISGMRLPSINLSSRSPSGTWNAQQYAHTPNAYAFQANR